VPAQDYLACMLPRSTWFAQCVSNNGYEGQFNGERQTQRQYI
jgi:hypothetical protein